MGDGSHECHQSETLESASRFLREHPGAKMIAGGTDLIPRLNQKIESKEDVCFLDNIPEMREIRKQEENHVVIGALTKLVELCESPDLSSYTALIEAAGKVASPQIRNQATIGGNILQENRCMYFNQAVFWSDVNRCFKRGGDRCYQYKNSKECMALFQSDIAPVLIAYGATAFIYNNGSQREMPVIDLYLPAGKKNLGNEDFLLGFKLPAFKENDLSAYSRRALRGSFDFPIVSCAVYAKKNEKWFPISPSFWDRQASCLWK